MSKYYSLKVSQAKDVKWKSRLRFLGSKAPSLYLEVEHGKGTQRTNTIEGVNPLWEETLPLICDDASTLVSVKLKHESKMIDTTIGRTKVRLSELLNKTELRLSRDGRPESKHMATVVCHLKPSNAKAIAGLALKNLLSSLANRSLSTTTPAEKFFDKGNAIVTEGMNAIKENSGLVDALKDAVPTIDNIVEVMDKIADANPYLKVAWYMASALYQVVSEQVKADKRFRDLVETLVKIFNFVRDTEHLGDILQSFQSTISELLDVIVECCLLMRKHARHSFAIRALNMADKAKIEELGQSLNGLKAELNAGFALQTAKGVDDLKLYHSLNQTNASDRPCCLPGTRTAIQEKIKNWASLEEAPNIFWLNGIAGSGKSTVATSIAEHFRSESRLGAYLFFTRDKSDPNSLIRDLAEKLASASTSIAAHVSSSFAQLKDMPSASADVLFKELIRNPLTECASEFERPIIIILDALDECGEPSSRSFIMRLLQNEFPNLPSKFRFLITSRPEVDISDALTSEASKQHVEAVELDSSSPESRADVRAYLDFALGKAIAKQKPTGLVWNNLINALSDAAAGLFIWASTLVKIVLLKTFKLKYLQDLVSNKKSLSLHDLYRVTLKDAFLWDDDTKSTFSKVIALVLFGNTKLTDKTIDSILDLPPNEGSAIILSKLRSLIAYESGKPISLHHASFYDYMVSQCSCPWPWFFDISSQKQLIAERCFDVMSSLRFNICDLETSFIRNDEVKDLDKRIERNIPPHLVYGCCFWAQHLRDVPFSDDLLEKLTTFAQGHLFYWFEALSLTKNFYQFAGQSLGYAIEWLGDKESELSELLRQAKKLASTFATPVSESTPHIYVSMLPLAEQHSLISAQYAKLTSSIITVDRRGSYMTSLLKILEGHTSFVTAVGFSSDGKHVVSGSYDNTVRVWEVESGKLVGDPFKGHSDKVISVGFSSDGKRVVSGSRDKTVRVWEVESGKLIGDPFKGHTSIVTSVGFSSNGKRVVSGSADNTVRVWEIESGKLVGDPFRGHSDRVISVGLSSDGKRVVSGSEDNTVRVWEVESGKLVGDPFKGHSDRVISVGFSSDGKRVVSGSWDNTVRVWEVESGKLVGDPFNGHTREVTSVGFSSDGKRVVSGSWDKTVRVWEIESGKLIGDPFNGHTREVTSVGFSSDGKRVVSGSYDNTVRIWEAESSKHVGDPFKGHTREVTSVGLSSDGKRVVSGSVDRTVRIWEVESGKLIGDPFKGHTSIVTSVGFSSNGKRVVSGSADDTVRVWEAESGRLVGDPFKGHTREVTSVGFSYDGKRVVSGSSDKTVRVWEVESGKLIGDPFKGHSDRVISVGFSSDGKRVVSGSSDNTVRVWEVENGKLVGDPFIGHIKEVTSVGFSFDGKRVVSGSSDNTVLVWEVESGNLVGDPFKGHSDRVTSVGISSDGKRVVSGSFDNTVRVWEVETGKLNGDPFIGHTEPVTSVGISSDGKRVVSGSCDKTVRVWEVESGEQLSSTFDIPINTVSSSTLSQDGKHIGSISPEISIRVSDVDTAHGLSSSPGEFSNWTMSEDYWIRSKEGRLLLWIPPDIRPTLWRARNVGVFSCQFSTRLDFKNCELGQKWYKGIES